MCSSDLKETTFPRSIICNTFILTQYNEGIHDRLQAEELCVAVSLRAFQISKEIQIIYNTLIGEFHEWQVSGRACSGHL